MRRRAMEDCGRGRRRSRHRPATGPLESSFCDLAHGASSRTGLANPGLPLDARNTRGYSLCMKNTKKTQWLVKTNDGLVIARCATRAAAVKMAEALKLSTDLLAHRVEEVAA